MKKKLLISLAILAATCLYGFKAYNHEGSAPQTDCEDMRILTYHGHRYVCYRFSRNSIWADHSYGYGGAGLIHDPDCWCQNKDKNNIANQTK